MMHSAAIAHTAPVSGAVPSTVGERLWSIHLTTLVVAGLIAAIGAALLYSTSGGNFSPRAEAHIVRFLVGLGVVFLLTAIPLRSWLILAYPSYALCLALLALVPFFGAEFGGSRRWLEVGPVTVQPSEFMKVAVVLATARYFQWVPTRRMSDPRFLLVPALIVFAPIALVLPQPDLGTSVLLALSGLAILFLAGVSWWYFIGGGTMVLASLPFVWAQLHDYQRQRVLTFLEPERDPLNAGYQIFQAKIAFAAGGMNGKGFVQGTQSQLNFLPEKHTDFIFPMLAEEFGLVGTMTLLGLFALLLVLLTIIALSCRSHFARLLAGGAAALIFVHMFVNIAMVTGLIPVVGAPLPLVSYGGTSMLTIMLALGLAMNAHVHRHERFVRRDIGAVV
ncbi:MAG: rod shape-determining protein RodA [Pseudomonadota bacterium]